MIERREDLLLVERLVLPSGSRDIDFAADIFGELALAREEELELQQVPQFQRSMPGALGDITARGCPREQGVLSDRPVDEPVRERVAIEGSLVEAVGRDRVDRFESTVVHVHDALAFKGLE